MGGPRRMMVLDCWLHPPAQSLPEAGGPRNRDLERAPVPSTADMFRVLVSWVWIASAITPAAAYLAQMRGSIATRTIA
jgi:hypothetical protein